jgi:hypothetical protein
MNTLVEIRGHKKKVGKIPTLLCNTSVLCNTSILRVDMTFGELTLHTYS